MDTGPKLLNQHTRATFVRQGVETNEITEAVIKACMPYYPRTVKVIGGYVDDSKQYWKANFHWEYLLRYMDKALAMDIDEKYEKCVKAIRAVHTKNRPNPDKGYTASRVMGQPKDASSKETIIARWKTVKQSKKDFRRVLDRSGLLGTMKKKEKKQWLLAVAPVARPGTSKHSRGWALDLYGDNAEIKKISHSLHASLVYPEGSHVHVEFAKGVNGKPLPGIHKAAAVAPHPAADPHYTADSCVLLPGELGELMQDLRNARVTGDFSDGVTYADILGEVLDDIPDDIALA